MMRRIVQSSLRYRFLAIAGALVLVSFGGLQLRDTSVDVFPEFAPPRVEIQTACLGLTAAEVEELITVPLEQNLQGVPDLDVMRSKSVTQLSSIELIFEPGTDLMLARQLVQERVASMAGTLPSWAAPPVMIQPLSATSRVLKIGMSSDEIPMIDLSMTAYWKVRARLLGVPGVANVAIWGQRREMLFVKVDPERLRRQGVTLEQAMKVTSESLDAGLLKYTSGTLVGTGGAIETPNQRIGIQHTLPIVTAPDLERVAVGQAEDGSTIRLRDVAVVERDHQPLSGDAVINDGDGLMLIVEKLPWANTLDVTNGVEATLAELEPGLTGIEVDSTIFRPATFIEIALENLTSALFIGSLLVILILTLFLFEWRSALISAVAIPVSLLGALIVLDVTGTTINTMVLAGLVIAVGVVVDDAIIDIENIVRRLRQHRADGSGGSTARVVLEASVEVRSAITYATLINVVAVVPVFFLDGLTGSFFRPLATAYALAVLVSMVVALTLTPALAFLLLSHAPLTRRQPPLVRLLQRGYVAILTTLMARTRALFAGFALVLVAGVAAVPTLGQSLLPDFKERDFLMHWLTQPGTSHPEMVRITRQGSKELRDIEGVRNFGAHIGQASNADEVVGMYFGENWISVDPAVDYDETLAKVQETVDGYPGLFRDVQTYLKERIREVLTGSSDAIVVRVYGDDLARLRATAEEMRAEMAEIDGTAEVHVELQVEEPQIEVEVDLARAQRHGLKPGDVRRASAAIVGSEELGDLWTQGRVYDIRIWGVPEVRGDVTAIEQLMIDTPRGSQVALEDVADVRVAPTPNVIFHEGLSRYVEISSNVRGRDLGAVAEDIEEAVSEVELSRGYRVAVLGEFAERADAQRRLLGWSLAAGLVILLLLQVAFGSWRLAAVAFLTLPVALVGGVLAAYFTGGVISLGSLVGFLTVLGIAARNAIMLISHYQHLEREEGMEFGPELILRGARERVSPIMMTALAMALALLPLVVAGSIPGHEIEHPMAIVILGGLVSSTLLNLFAVPFLYLIFGRQAQQPPSTLVPRTA
ncbi:MAG: efflux RND transporter permease subunit [Nocardioides sp.]